MNRDLLNSAIFYGLAIFLLALFLYDPKDRSKRPLYAITFFAIGTSVLNHGTTNQYIKFVDRFTISVCAVVYAYYIYLLRDASIKFIAYAILGIMIFAYFYSKQKEIRLSKPEYELAQQSHQLTHFLALLLFSIIAYSQSTIKKDFT